MSARRPSLAAVVARLCFPVLAASLSRPCNSSPRSTRPGCRRRPAIAAPVQPTCSPASQTLSGFGWLEDSGYIPRLAIFSDRIFRLMGLNGKAVLPMVLGLGCDTMATMTTRILGTRKERVIAIMLLALGIPCSAQLATILGILGGISFYALLTLFGVVMTQMFLVGFLAARVLPGERSDFILELPPMRMPVLRNVLSKTGQRVRWYLAEAVPIFLVGTALLFVLDRSGLLRGATRLAEPVRVALSILVFVTTVARRPVWD